MNVFLVASGQSYEGYSVASVHTTYMEAVDAAHRLMDGTWGLRNVSREERKRIRTNADAFGGHAWEAGGLLVYVIKRSLDND